MVSYKSLRQPTMVPHKHPTWDIIKSTRKEIATKVHGRQDILYVNQNGFHMLVYCIK